MHNDKINLSLSLPALERMIGGCAEVEVKLRQQIVNNFCKAHLKELVTPAVLGPIAKAIEEELKVHVGKEVWDIRTGKFSAQVNDRVQALIATAIDRQLSRYVNDERMRALSDKVIESFDTHIERHRKSMLAMVEGKIREALADLPKRIDAALDKSFELRVQAEVQRRLEIAVRIKAELEGAAEFSKGL